MASRSRGGYPGSGSRIGEASSSKRSTPINPPREGSLNGEEDRGKSRKRSNVLPSPLSSLGQDTLRGPRITQSNTLLPVSTENFYGKPSDMVQSLASGTPNSRRLSMLRPSPDINYSPSQHRNAARSKPIGQEDTAKLGDTEPVIEIIDSEEDDVIESRPLTKRAAAKRKSQSRTDNASGSKAGRNNFGVAAISGSIRRKSDSPQEGRDASQIDWDEAEGIHLYQRPPPSREDLSPLNNDREMKISGPTSTSARRLEMKEKHVSQVDKMKNRVGQLGNRMPSGLPKKDSDMVINSRVDRAEEETGELQLASVGLCGMAQIKSETSNPTFRWKGGGNFELRWKYREKEIRIPILSTGIAALKTYEDSITRGVCIELENSSIILDCLSRQLEAGTRNFLNQTGVDVHQTISLIFMRDPDSNERWKDLLQFIKKSAVRSYQMDRNSILLFKSEFEHMKELHECSLVKSPFARTHEALGPLSTTSQPANREPTSTRLVSRANARDEERDSPVDNPKRNKVDIQIPAKVNATIEPQKALLSYPLGSPGGVNVFQSDLDKLDDNEMLNDTIIEFGLRYLLEDIKKRNPELYDQIYVFSSFFYKRFNENKRDRKTAYGFVKKWTRKVDIFQKKYLVVPINEKVHWYLAIITNPFYAIREVERIRNLYESNGEMEEDKDDIEQKESDMEMSQGRKEDESKELAVQEGETLRDTVMKENATNPSVEIVIAPPHVKTNKPSVIDSFESMEMNKNREEGPLKMQSETFLKDMYAESKRTIYSTPVIDKRTRTSHRPSITLSDDEMDSPQSAKSRITPKGRLSQSGRPGLSDGIRNVGKGSLVGGGGRGIPFAPGQIETFKEEDRLAASNKKRKVDEEDTEMSATPPLQSRSGSVATNGFTKLIEKRVEAAQERHQEWLKSKAVCCVFDSMGNSHKGVRTALKEYLCLEYNDKKGGDITVEDVELEHIDVVSPIQGNLCDCGLYLLHSFERFFHNPKKVMNKVIVLRNRDNPYWQAEDAAKKRQWWRTCIDRLITEYKANQAQVKAEREARLALKDAARKEEEDKSKTSTSSSSRDSSSSSESLNGDIPTFDTAPVESSLEEPVVVKAT